MNGFLSSVQNVATELYGIALGFGLIEDKSETRCKLNNISLEWVKVKSDDRSKSLKSHNLEDIDSSLISSNAKKENRKYSIDVKLTPIKTPNGKEIYDEIVELWENNTICTITTNQFINNLIILKVSNQSESETSIDFSIDFEQLEFARIKRDGEIAEDDQTTLNQPSTVGVTGVGNSSIPGMINFLGGSTWK